jgi:hypothetical protein
MRRLLAIALLVSGGLSQAQVRMGMGFSGGHSFGRPMAAGHIGANFSFGFPARRESRHHFVPNQFFLAAPFVEDYPEVVVPEAPTVIVLQTAAAAPKPEEQAAAAMPLLIELQGSHYVRYGGREQMASRGTTVQSDYAGEFRAENPTKGELKASRRDLPPAILIFRDGRREEVSSYSIFGGAIYVNSDYWSSGAWTRKIQIADLDLPKTLKLNQERGVRFSLPTGPNEVVTRP